MRILHKGGMGWKGHVERMGMRKLHSWFLARKPEGKRRLRKMSTEKKTQPSCPCSRDLNWTGKGLKSMAGQLLGSSGLGFGSFGLPLCEHGNETSVSIKYGEFLNGWATESFSRCVLFH
jgi:hypothetical protein